MTSRRQRHRPAGWPRETTAAAGGRPADRRHLQRREPRPRRSAAEVRRAWPDLIVDNLRAPDLVALEEIQDNNGPTNDAVVDAGADLRQADRRDPGGRRPDLPVPPDRPGGRPGRRRAGRQHPRRLPVPHRPRPGVRRPPGRDADRATTVAGTAGGHPALLQPRPHRPRQRAPSTTAASRWPASSPSTASTLFVIANHFNSKGGDQPLFGRFQPPTRAQRGAAAPAGHGRRTTSSADPRGSRPQRQRRGARRLQRLRVLRPLATLRSAACSAT